jgi:hypothetical protein
MKRGRPSSVRMPWVGPSDVWLEPSGSHLSTVQRMVRWNLDLANSSGRLRLVITYSRSPVLRSGTQKV